MFIIQLILILKYATNFSLYIQRLPTKNKTSETTVQNLDILFLKNSWFPTAVNCYFVVVKTLNILL